MPKSVYEQIKKQNGETFAKTIRVFDEGIFEIPDIVARLKYAGRDAEPIKELLSSLRLKHQMSNSNQTPYELLKKAGYNAFYADTYKKQNSIAPYFLEREKLCTFRDKNRYKNYYIIHCIKEGAEKLKRADFIHPEREDAYGTSVISIQIAKSGGFIKILNRYNHSVSFPDNTFNSNPDNIIEGLTHALKKEFNVDFLVHQKMPPHFIFLDEKLIKYNFELDGTYFGDGFHVSDGHIHDFNKDNFLLIDHFLLDFKTKKVSDLVIGPVDMDSFFDSYECQDDSFAQVLQKEVEGKILQVKKISKLEKALLADGVQILRTKESQLTHLYLPTTRVLPNRFLNRNETLETFFAPHLRVMGNRSFERNREIKYLYLPRLQNIGDYFLMYNNKLKYLNIPMVKEIGHMSMREVQLERMIAPCLTFIAGDVFIRARNMEIFSAPNLIKINRGVLDSNDMLKRFYAPKWDVSFPFFRDCGLGIERSENCFLLTHPKRKKLIDNRANLNRMLKKISFFERVVDWLQGR